MQLAIVPRLHHPRRPEVVENPLEDRLAAHFEDVARQYLDPDRIEAIAEDLRIVQRRRVHSAGLVAAAFVVSAFEGSSDTEGRILDGWQTYLALGGVRSGESSFRRMAHKMVPVLRRQLRKRLRELGKKTQHPELAGRLESFADVLVPDGCGFKLAAALSGMYPGTGTPAELKLHAVYSIRAGAVIDVSISAGSVHDSDGFHPQWERDALYIWDLGYNSYPRFIDAVEAGAHALQRLKDGANPIVLASYSPEGHRRPLQDRDGKPLSLTEACQFGYVHRQRVLDLDVEICDGKRKVVARVVCVPVDGEDRYYLTSLPREVFSAHDIAELYRLRWEVELFFRNWKGGVRLDQVRRLSNPASIELAITASMLAALLARDVSTRLNEMAKELDASTNEALPP